MKTTKAAPTKTTKRAATNSNAAATPKKKKSGAQRRKEAREREAAALAAQSPVSLLDAIVDATNSPKPADKPVDPPVVVTPPAPAVGPNGVPTLDGIFGAKKAADEKKAAKHAKRAPKPKKDPKSYHVALSSLSRMNQRDLTWRAGDMVKRGKFESFDVALASVLVNMNATVVDKYDGGTNEPIVNAPSVVAFILGLDDETRAAVKRTTAARTPRAAKTAATANALAIAFAGEMLEALGPKRAASRLAGMLAKARETTPDRVPYLEAAVAEAERVAALAPAPNSTVTKKSRKTA